METSPIALKLYGVFLTLNIFIFSIFVWYHDAQQRASRAHLFFFKVSTVDFLKCIQ